MRASLSFRHGVHPPDRKELTAEVPIRRMPFPDEVVLPLQQHAGKPARLVVRPGQRVERGDLLAEADGFISAPVHASAAGTVKEVRLWPHPNGSHSPAVRIAVEPFSAQAPRPRMVPDWQGLEPKEMVAAIRDAGVVGLGGAAFPTHVKLSPPEGSVVDALVINGCECEPYLTTDHRSMVEYPERVQLGTRIMMRCLGAKRALIGIERNKPDAIEAIRRTLPSDIPVEVCPLTVKYPQGAEKMLIEALVGREVPSGKLPIEVGVVVQNVASVATIAEVFETGLPLIERIVTVTGGGVKRPGNLIVPVGTKLRDLLEACDGLTDDAREVIFGGPMMGAAQANLDVPVLKGTSGIVVLDAAEVEERRPHPCIRCGHCLDACPVYLNPQLLGSLAMAKRWDEMQEEHLLDCMLCGCCSYTCPSKIPLSQLFALAKAALRRSAAA
ncbi:MAG: electron transport complex subunit RsxC [Deltaproteobacteria bacterium]|nr:electron transport complex subunit RsxC [Deltaproteobacteria bacterium]MBW2417582.1 electron transport complex subunit RsxC [Deltaproteobacteria bacterium]